ncbi:uncharacterized protein P174DRAFT_416105 [Aspergillus novofumigatus IBT 16806]|uniref:Uncharacterized protein n=1 Tax=Aspergillus novofumigatus (strain IBT 16806) TaxID=1392255 RepID=A0A2I1CL67_ASPN1|nr:uncharacterized protein P174DRAFT_416105 [Aspergillus novofumigatus IBT 16806]PKX98364.1 hypothetical protein P174DRAFT_416105 [Aspergillus novofumigatus IBT 16806]
MTISSLSARTDSARHSEYADCAGGPIPRAKPEGTTPRPQQPGQRTLKNG